MNRMEWLDARRFTPDGGYRITASDVAASIGWHPTRSALDVALTKLTGAAVEDTDEMLMGRLFEDPIAQFYASKTGRHVINPGDTALYIHPDFPWLAATPDRFTWEAGEEEQVDGSPLEIKNGGHYKLNEWRDGCPLWVQIQVQIQMACLAAQWGSYCGIIGGQPFYGDLERNDSFIDSTIVLLEHFISALNRGEIPQVTSHRDLAPIKKLYPLDNGDSIVLGRDDLDKANRLEQCKIDLKTSIDERDTIEAEIRSILGDATFGILPDGTILTLKTTVRKDGKSYRTLRRVSA